MNFNSQVPNQYPNNEQSQQAGNYPQYMYPEQPQANYQQNMTYNQPIPQSTSQPTSHMMSQAAPQNMSYSQLAPQSVNQSTGQPINQPTPQIMNQPTGQVMSQAVPQNMSYNQLTPQFVNQSTGQPINQPTPQSMNQPTGQVMSQAVPQNMSHSQLTPQSVNQSMSQPIAQPINQSKSQPIDNNNSPGNGFVQFDHLRPQPTDKGWNDPPKNLFANDPAMNSSYDSALMGNASLSSSHRYVPGYTSGQAGHPGAMDMNSSNNSLQYTQTPDMNRPQNYPQMQQQAQQYQQCQPNADYSGNIPSHAQYMPQHQQTQAYPNYPPSNQGYGQPMLQQQPYGNQMQGVPMNYNNQYNPTSGMMDGVSDMNLRSEQPGIFQRTFQYFGFRK